MSDYPDGEYKHCWCLGITTIIGCPLGCKKMCAQEVFVKRYVGKNRLLTRKRQGWHRKTSKDKKAELLLLAREKLTGSNLQVADKDLTHRYRSNAKERDIIKAYEALLKPEKKKV